MMIRLKNGYEIKYQDDFDQFFNSLLEAIIRESQKQVMETPPEQDHTTTPNEVFLRELMDNCIYVTHQLFEMAKKSEEFSKFMVTGFIFNSVILALSNLDADSSDEEDDDSSVIH